jgi:hypothetical protein
VAIIIASATPSCFCYLRYPGRPLKAGERPPWPLSCSAEQIDALPEAIEDYLAAERNRRRHAAERLGATYLDETRFIAL